MATATNTTWLKGKLKMSCHTLKYKLDDEGIKVMLGCAGRQMIAEQGEAIAEAFREVDITIEVDDDWGLCSITHVNGREVSPV